MKVKKKELMWALDKIGVMITFDCFPKGEVRAILTEYGEGVGITVGTGKRR